MNNLYSQLRQRFPADLAKPLLVDEKGAVLSYGDAEQQSARIANYFTELGLPVGERVAVQVKKSPYALMVYLACLRAGLVYLPLNSGYSDAELEYFIEDAAPALLICDPADSERLGGLFKNQLIGTLAAEGNGTVKTGADQCSPAFRTRDVQADDLAAILYTSGTTGRPKGAMLSHGNLASNALMLKDYWGWTSEDVLLHALPIFHVHGLFVACHCAMAAGASMIFLPGFDVDQVANHLPQATVMMGVPTFYTRLLAHPQFGVEHCRSMRLFISGSAPLLASTHQQFYQRTGHTILERYGMSETGMLVSNPLVGERRAGAVGFPLPGVEVRIVDKGQQPVATDAIGAIQVKGDNVFQGYWQMPEKTAAEFTRDGYFITGDQGTISADGYISIVGRAKDMVITGGFNVYPKEVELALDRLPGVKESAVFGIADRDFGEAVVAALVPEDEGQAVDSAELREQLKQRLAAYKVPKQFYWLGELPRNTMGKVQKNRLRDWDFEV